MALPTQPNGSTDVRVQASPALTATAQGMNLTAQTQKTIQQDNGNAISETGIVITN